MTGHEDGAPDRIDSSFRYGSTIIIGVLSGFSLAFLTAWAANPLEWGAKDLLGLIPLVLGIVCELAAIWILLDPTSLQLAVYRRAILWFKIGIILVCLGAAAAIAVDYVALTANFRPASAGGH